MARTIDIHVKLDPRTFRRYCAFDTFRRQRRWYPPVIQSTEDLTCYCWLEDRWGHLARM